MGLFLEFSILVVVFNCSQGLGRWWLVLMIITDVAPLENFLKKEFHVLSANGELLDVYQ